MRTAELCEHLEPGLAPREYPRRVLLCVCGLSPQVITETVFACACCVTDAERLVPTEVQVITTSAGAQVIRNTLFGSQPPVLERLCADHGLPAILFTEHQIRVVADESGTPLADIRTSADNTRMADALTEVIREITGDPRCALHVSIAGGRKSMGYYAGYVTSLFARPQDRLSHVLAAAPFESSPDFFYPTPSPQAVHDRSGQVVGDAGDARVELALIPFVRLRLGLPQRLLNGQSGFAEVVGAAAAATAPPALIVDLAKRCIVADGCTIELQPMAFCLLAALVGRALTGRPALVAPPREAHDPAWAAEVLNDLRRAVGWMNVDSHFETSISADCSGAKVSPHWSRLRRALHEHLAPGRAELYFDDGGRHHGKRYRVPLPPAAIRVTGAAR